MPIWSCTPGTGSKGTVPRPPVEAYGGRTLLSHSVHHVDVPTHRMTVYAQSRMREEADGTGAEVVISPPQLDPGVCGADPLNGQSVCAHANAVYLDGSGEERTSSDGTGAWWVKHSWVLDGEGYRNCQLMPPPDQVLEYGSDCVPVIGRWQDDELTMLVGPTTPSGELAPIYNERRRPRGETDATPYDSGPQLVGAKLNHVGEEPLVEGGVPVLDEPLAPNDEFALYGGGDFRLRVLTSGGFSPDGVTGVTPDQYEDFFRVHATAEDGSTVLLSEVGVDYEVDGGTLRVIGLSDLGKVVGDDVHYDDCYVEDGDNYIDIILVGDEAAARSVTHVEIPAEGDHLPFCNPGGPGPEPFPGVRYSAPGPPDLEPVTIALDDPMRVSHPG